MQSVLITHACFPLLTLTFVACTRVGVLVYRLHQRESRADAANDFQIRSAARYQRSRAVGGSEFAHTAAHWQRAYHH